MNLLDIFLLDFILFLFCFFILSLLCWTRCGNLLNPWQQSSSVHNHRELFSLDSCVSVSRSHWLFVSLTHNVRFVCEERTCSRWKWPRPYRKHSNDSPYLEARPPWVRSPPRMALRRAPNWATKNRLHRPNQLKFHHPMVNRLRTINIHHCPTFNICDRFNICHNKISFYLLNSPNNNRKLSKGISYLLDHLVVTSPRSWSDQHRPISILPMKSRYELSNYRLLTISASSMSQNFPLPFDQCGFWSKSLFRSTSPVARNLRSTNRRFNVIWVMTTSRV